MFKWLIIRKQWRVGMLNINLSKKGLGFSFGKRGLRVGRNARGSEYFEASHGGASYRKTHKFKKP